MHINQEIPVYIERTVRMYDGNNRLNKLNDRYFMNCMIITVRTAAITLHDHRIFHMDLYKIHIIQFDVFDGLIWSWSNLLLQASLLDHHDRRTAPEFVLVKLPASYCCYVGMCFFPGRSRLLKIFQIKNTPFETNLFEN